MEEIGLKKLMKDLGVKDFKELNEYINNPLHREEAIVIEFKKFLEYVKTLYPFFNNSLSKIFRKIVLPFPK